MQSRPRARARAPPSTAARRPEGRGERCRRTRVGCAELGLRVGAAGLVAKSRSSSSAAFDALYLHIACGISFLRFAELNLLNSLVKRHRPTNSRAFFQRSRFRTHSIWFVGQHCKMHLFKPHDPIVDAPHKLCASGIKAVLCTTRRRLPSHEHRIHERRVRKRRIPARSFQRCDRCPRRSCQKGGKTIPPGGKRCVIISEDAAQLASPSAPFPEFYDRCGGYKIVYQ